MKKIICFLFLCIGLSLETNAQSITLLKPNEVYKSPPNAEMVVLDKYTFGSYHYTASKYDTLKQEVGRLETALQAKDSTETSLYQQYDKLCQEKQELINSYESSFKRLNTTLTESLNQQNRLQVDYLKLEQKNKRVKRWRNSFMGVTGILAGIIVLSIVK